MSEPRYQPNDACGPYRIARFLKSGGMGDVYVARHRDTGGAVALKCLRHRYQASHEMAARMQREARFLGRIRHPNIVLVLDAGVADDGTLWMAMELLDGKTLREFLRALGRFTIPDALFIALKISDALGEVHEWNVIHRDVKPENVMLTMAREVKLLDFGIAKSYDLGDLHSTDRTSTFGTPHYMSPEHLRGEKVDARTDIYALGLILYEMLAGRHAFADAGEPLTSDQVSQMQIHGELSPPPDGSARCPSYVWPILERALQKRREDRYASMSEFHDDIRDAGRRTLKEGEMSVLFPGISTPPKESHEDAESLAITAPVLRNTTGGAPAGERSPEPAGARRFWNTRPRSAGGRARAGAEVQAREGETVELQRGADPFGDGFGNVPFAVIMPPSVLPFRAAEVANDSTTREPFGRAVSSRETEGEAKATSTPTMPIRSLSLEEEPAEDGEDVPTKRTGTDLSLVPAQPPAFETPGKLPRHVWLALVLGPLASSALTVGLMQVFLFTRAPEPQPVTDEKRATALAEPLEDSARHPLTPPCPAVMDCAAPPAQAAASTTPTAPAASTAPEPAPAAEGPERHPPPGAPVASSAGQATARVTQTPETKTPEKRTSPQPSPPPKLSGPLRSNRIF